MAFMNKETCKSEAERLGVDIEGLSWQDQLSAVIAAQKADGSLPAPANKGTSVKGKAHRSVRTDMPTDKRKLDQLKGKTILASPEMAMTAIQPFGFEEEIGDDVTVDESAYDKLLMTLSKGSFNTSDERDKLTQSVTATGSTGRSVKALTGLPKWNAQLTFDVDKDMAFVAEFKGKKGYLWTHPTLFNVKELLDMAGVTTEYEEDFIKRQFYVGVSLLCVPIDYTHFVIHQIEKKKRDEQRIYGR